MKFAPDGGSVFAMVMVVDSANPHLSRMLDAQLKKPGTGGVHFLNDEARGSGWPRVVMALYHEAAKDTLLKSIEYCESVCGEKPGTCRIEWNNQVSILQPT